MSTESKENRNTANATTERHATDKQARDEQNAQPQARYQKLHENWKGTKDEFRKAHTQVTDQDLEMKPGNEQATFDRVGQRLNKTPEEARKMIEDTAEKTRQRTNTPTSEDRQRKPQA